MRVLITGAAGFVGSQLSRRLAAEGHDVAGTYIGAPPDLAGVELYEADLLDPAALAQAVAKARPEAVVHLAGLSHVGESWRRPAEYFRVNVLGAENMLRAAAGARLVAASSAEVYGAVPEREQPIPESRAVAPQSPYALTKAAMERLALAAGAVVVRSFNIVGPGQASRFALPAFAGQLAAIHAGRQRPVLQVGNLAARRDFLHVEDAVAGYRAVLERGEPGGVYNLGSGQALSIADALERLIALSGVEARVEVDEARFRPVDLPLLAADGSRLRALGWAPQRTLDDALRDLWAASASRGADAAPPA